MLLVKGQVFRLAVNRRARGKHDVPDSRLRGGVYDVYRPGDVVARVFFRVQHGFAGGFGSGQVDKRVEAARALHRLREAGVVVNVPVDEGRAGEQVFPQAAGKVVEHGYAVALLKKFLRDVAADVPRAADNQNVHAPSVAQRRPKQ